MVSRAEAREAVKKPEQAEIPASDSGAKVDAPAKTPKEKVVKEPTDCVCAVPDNGPVNDQGKAKYPGCNGAKSTRKFAPGHDAKLVGYLTRQYEAGEVTAEQAIEQVREKSGGSALLLGKIKAAIKAVDQRKEAKERREAAAKAKAEADAEANSPEAEVNDQAVALAEEQQVKAGV